MHEAYSTLIDTPELRSRLDDPDLVVVDCRFSLADTDSGRSAWREGHIPGAVYAHLDEDLSGSLDDPERGRHPLPDLHAFTDIVRSWGTDSGDQVVAYDDSGGAIAARLWWMMRSLGHESVAVLDGGWQAWTRAGGPVSTDQAEPSSGDFQPSSKLADWPRTITTAQVLESIDSDGHVLLDARDSVRFTGQKEPLDPVPGHIPGAVSRPFKKNLDSSGQFLDASMLRERFGDIADTDREVVSYCGSGVTACHNILAMVAAGLSPPILYPSSWSGWVADLERPVESGN